MSGSVPSTIIGIDPGLHHVGWAILNEHSGRVVATGLIKYPEPGKHQISAYLEYILPRLTEVLDEHKPASGAVEQVTWMGKRRRIAIPLGHIAGAVVGLLWARQVPAYLLTPSMKLGVSQARPRNVSDHEYDAVLLARKVRAYHRAVDTCDPKELRRLKTVEARQIRVAA